MEKLILADGSEIEIQDGATLNSVIVLMDSYAGIGDLALKLTDENLRQIQFETDDRISKAENMALKEPNFFVTTLANGKIQCVFGLREKTKEEIYQDSVLISLEYLTDEQSLTVAVLYPEWMSGKEMKTGYRCRYNDVLYKCLQDHTSQDDWKPDVTPSLWAKVLVDENNDTIPEWEQPESTNPYAKGDKVTHNGKKWESTTDGNVWEPGIYGWTEVTE